jgi:hypothetical protein
LILPARSYRESHRTAARLQSAQQALPFSADLHGLIVDHASPPLPEGAGHLQELASQLLPIHLSNPKNHSQYEDGPRPGIRLLLVSLPCRAVQAGGDWLRFEL